MAAGRMHSPYPPPGFDPRFPAISYGNHQKSVAYFSHLAPLILFIFTKRRSQKGGTMALPLNTLLFTSVLYSSIVVVLLNTAKDGKGLQIDVLNTVAKNDKGLGITP